MGGEIREWPEPKVQDPGEVLIEGKACGICGSDVHFYEWPQEMHAQRLKALAFPRVLGHEAAGVLKEVGKEVKDFKVGHRVVCETWGGCGLGYYCRLGRFNHRLHQKRIGQKVDGGMAKYMVVPSLSLYKIPEALSYDQGAVVEPLGVARPLSSGLISSRVMTLRSSGPGPSDSWAPYLPRPWESGSSSGSAWPIFRSYKEKV